MDLDDIFGGGLFGDEEEDEVAQAPANRQAAPVDDDEPFIDIWGDDEY